jgi:hypothetical protein
MFGQVSLLVVDQIGKRFVLIYLARSITRNLPELGNSVSVPYPGLRLAAPPLQFDRL